MRPIARKGDPTFGYCYRCEEDTDGTIIEGCDDTECMGQPISRIGHLVQCNRCGTTAPIVTGCDYSECCGGMSISRVGDITSGELEHVIQSGCEFTWCDLDSE